MPTRNPPILLGAIAGDIIGSVYEPWGAFLESEDVESAIRLAISLGGDADTQACIAGGIAHAHFGELPEEIEAEVRKLLPPEMLSVAEEFAERYGRGH